MNKAVIFDMDGVLVDSEGLWKIAEKEVFSSLGVILDDESCELTKSMTTLEVTKFWFSKYPWNGKEIHEVEQMVVNRVTELIENVNCEIEGIQVFIKKLKSKGFKIGLATNSPYQIIPKVLSKLELTELFDCTVSAEFEKYGKPHPDVYLTALNELDEPKEDCVAIEDSYSGIEAAKRAGMTVIGFTNKGRNTNLAKADYLIDEYKKMDWQMFGKL